MLKRLALLLVLGLGVLVPSSHAQEPSNPYIYYFSDALNAFIIERADGTDTHVLGDGLMALTGDSQDIYVTGPGWSPSGKWFAWTAAQVSNNGYGWSGYRPYILSADGTQRLTLLDHLQDAQIAWVANEDVLFVVSRQSTRLNPDDLEDHHSVIDTYFAVIDVPSGAVLSSVEDRTFSDYYLYHETSLRPTVVQTTDGEHFIVRHIDYEGGDSYDGTALLVVLDADGAITEKRLDAFEPVNIEGYYGDFPSISPAGWVAYPTEDSFRVENLLSGEQLVFPPLDEPQSDYADERKIYWDASGQYALIDDGNLRLLDCHTATLTLLRENWTFNNEYFSGERPIWSPRSQYALLLGADNLLYAFDRAGGQLTALSIDTGKRYPDVAWYWLDDTHPVLYNTAEKGLMIYDLESSNVQHIDLDITTFSQPRLSPDARYVATVDDGAIIYDRETATELDIRPDYRSFFTVNDGQVLWHDSGDWLFVFDDALVAGGANIRYLDIMRADGTLRRDLSFSWTPNPITLNWLPSQVDPADLPPPVRTPLFPQPERTLHGSQWSVYVDWSPDGRWLAAGLGWGSGGDIMVWEAATGEIVHVLKDASEDERVVWSSGDEFVPALDIPGDEPVWGITDGILAHSPDGHQLVQNKDQRTQVIDAETGTVLTELPGEWDTWFWSATYSPNGHLLAAANPYMPVRIWNTATWELVAVLPNPGQAVAFSPDGTQLAVTASWDVQIWDVATLLGSAVH